MEDKFIVTPKKFDRKETKAKVMSLRIDLDLQTEFGNLALLSGHSRNELMCMALRYALDHLEFIPDKDQ